MNRIRLISAIVACVLGFTGAGASASFTYSVAPVTVSTNFGAGSNFTQSAFNGGAASGTLSGTLIINLAQITQSSTTVSPATDVAGVPLAPDVITINNQNGGGSGSFTINGTFNVTRSDTQGSASTFTPGTIAPPLLTLGTFTYALSNPQYAAPTIGAGSNGNGSLSYTITETAVPEPATLGLLALAAAACVRRRR